RDALQLEQKAQQFLDLGRHTAVGHARELVHQRVDAIAGQSQVRSIGHAGLPRVRGSRARVPAWVVYSIVLSIVGECRFSSTLPLPRYMCTPHGRHGSKLRTVRMMSMPLNVSGGFSSKMGVPCTASSYGPGVP